MPRSDVDLVSREFQQDCVVAGGVEWQCQSSQAGTLAPAAFTRKIRGVSIQGNPLRIELNTSDCEPFAAFENQDIDIWSEDEATSSDQSLHVRTKEHQGPTTQHSTRIDVINEVFDKSGTKHISDEMILVNSANTRISLVYDMQFKLSFRFKLRAGVSMWLVPEMYEFESWVQEEVTHEMKVKAQSQIEYTQSLATEIEFPVLAVPLTIAGIGVELGFFGKLKMQTRNEMNGKFAGSIGIRMSRAGKYGAKWDPSTKNMIPINIYNAIENQKIFEWGGKVIASVKPSIELHISMKLGLTLGYLGIGFAMSSGLKFDLQGEFKYGLGNLILAPVSATRIAASLNIINQPDCEKRHEGEVTVVARIRWLGVKLLVNPFGNYDILSQQDWLPQTPLLIACSASGGVDGVTLEYERIGGGSSGTSYADMSNSYQPPAPAPSAPPACVLNVDCPPRPGSCAGGYTGRAIGAPCASGCANGVSTVRCEPETCCRAENKSPPANGQHTEIASSSWTSSYLTVTGGSYVEVRCNAGYELSGRNLGFQGLGTKSIGFQYQFGSTGNNPSNFRVWNFPLDSDYTPCVPNSLNPSISCRFSQSVPGNGGWELEPRICARVSCGSFPSVVNGKITPIGERKFGETVAITCNTGFTLTGDDRFSATPVCQANGQFTSGKLCAKSACGSFSSVFSHGSAFPSSGVVSGQHLLITCDEGYQVSGDSSILCESGVYQITNQPSCNRISCGNFQVANGRAVPSTNILFGDKAEIKCNAGYFLSQQSAGSQNQAECTTYGLSAVCCSVLPCVAVCYSVALRVTVCCSVLQCDLCYCGALKC